MEREGGGRENLYSGGFGKRERKDGKVGGTSCPTNWDGSGAVDLRNTREEGGPQLGRVVSDFWVAIEKVPCFVPSLDFDAN